jgi:hypothetical protein
MSNAVTATGILIKRGAIAGGTPVAITSNAISVAGAPTSVLTAAPHGYTSGDEVVIAGVTGSTPTINGARVVTVIDATHFSVPIVTTVAGTGGTTTAAFQTVGELTEVTPGGMSRNKIETTTHNDGSESHVLGILRQSDPGMKINYVGTDATHVAVIADLVNNVKNNWKILFPSGVSRTGQAYVQQFMFDQATPDSKQGATLTIAWAGPVVEVAA